MGRILVLYATVDGQARRIAERMGEVLGARGHAVDLQSAATVGRDFTLTPYDAIVLGASIRYDRYPAYVKRLVAQRIAPLAHPPTAFFSVCLSAGGPGARPATAQRYIDQFLGATRWYPAHVGNFAGALLYTRYHFAIRWLMRMIMAMVGGETDMSRDHEYTDWAQVEAFARSLFPHLGDRARARRGDGALAGAFETATAQQSVAQ